jgi:retron-type reverse transcriptase
LDNLWKLKYDLDSNRYNISKSLCFLTSSPKLREIFASDFRDRIVHHVLVQKLEPFYEKRFIFDVYNNRKNRGIHRAVKRAKSFMNATCNGYYLQLDIKGFFII